MKKPKVLVLCECSQEVALAFRAKGCVAYSCDIEAVSRGGDIRYHIIDDANKFLDGITKFRTQDGRIHRVSSWDVIIAHPPCTYLAKVGSLWMIKSGQINQSRYAKMQRAREFFIRCLDAPAHFVCVENPLPMRRAQLPPATTFLQPSWYGHKYTKKTLLWLKNLPPLFAQIVHPNPKEYVRASRGKYRSRTFHGVAQAMAEQWYPIIKSYLND